ncbi:MAG: class I SAM-dependent methyltransferase [Deltaproteobacteria bacterium]
MVNELPGEGLSVAKMPAHWLMARLGKRVLRPGGVQLTRWLLDATAISTSDDVIELAPGLGHTAHAILKRRPHSYTAVERDPQAARFIRTSLQSGPAACVLEADAASVPLADGSASVVFGEAMLSMTPDAHKRAIIGEARRLLRPGGRYAIHELGVIPDTIDATRLAELQQDLSRSIHVGVRINTIAGWRAWFEGHGFEVEKWTTLPMRLLEPARLVRDEGVARSLRFGFNLLRTPGAARRMLDVRATFRKHAANLCGVGIVARVV